MNTTSQQRLLYAIAGSCLLGAAGAVYWSAAGIAATDLTSSRSSGDGSVAVDDQQNSETTPGDAELTRSLRGPLYDPPPPDPPKPPVAREPAPKPPARKPKLELTLVGTIIDSDQSLAIVSDATGKFDIKGVGDSLELTPEGVQIQEIASEQVKLEYQGNESTLRLEKIEKPPAAGKRGNNRRRNQ